MIHILNIKQKVRSQIHPHENLFEAVYLLIYNEELSINFSSVSLHISKWINSVMVNEKLIVALLAVFAISKVVSENDA